MRGGEMAMGAMFATRRGRLLVVEPACSRQTFTLGAGTSWSVRARAPFIGSRDARERRSGARVGGQGPAAAVQGCTDATVTGPADGGTVHRPRAEARPHLRRVQRGCGLALWLP